MVDDVYQDRCDRVVLVSGDSDLVPAVDLIKAQFPQKEVIVYIPTRDQRRGAATELRAAADKDRNLPLHLLKKAQFPAQVPNSTGGFIQKPAAW